MSLTIYAVKFEQSITLISMYFYDGKVSLIDGTSVTILCLHVLIAHLIFIILGYVDYFQGI